ncbi:MAG: tetratricopeptide repeat protein [Candidatus Hydrogenedentes bacterium]|nr:tetratricopeptide repeat protein [Candidatus Hydrogenedentota bacterium]
MTRFYLPLLACWIVSTLGFSPAVTADVRTVDINNAGVDAYNAGSYDRAIELFEQAYNRDPNSPVVRRNLCNAYQARADQHARAGELRAAIKLLENATGVEPDNASPRLQLGAYYLRLNDVDAAIRYLEQAITMKPGDPDAHELLGEAYYRDNDLSSARAQWEYVLEVDPGRTALAERYRKAFREESVETGFDKWRSRHFQVTYPPDVPAQIRAMVTQILDRAYVDIGRQLGGVFPPPPIHAIFYYAGQFSEATLQQSHVGALYDGKIRAPLTQDDGTWIPEAEMRRRLTHEYTHVVIRQAGGPNVPWWINEGLAEFLSRSATPQDEARLRQLFQAGSVPSLRELESVNINALSREDVSMAYLHARAAVEMLWNRFGRARMTQLLQEISRNKPVEQALQEVYRRNYRILDRDLAARYQ